MALKTILRRSVSSVTPLATQLLGGQRSFNHHCGGALFTAVNHTRKTISGDNLLVPSVSRFFYSASPSLKRPSSDESLFQVIESEIKESLFQVIESEIKCAEESYEEGEDIPANFPFELKDNPGKPTVSLRREYQGETIHVEVESSSLVTGDEDYEDDDAYDTKKNNQPMLPMVIKISKSDGPCLEFGVGAYPDEIVIDSLSIIDPEMTEDQVAYPGPRFEELDENLQKAFHKYLEIRGIKPSVTNYVQEYMLNKDNREYTNWLKNLKKFVEA